MQPHSKLIITALSFFLLNSVSIAQSDNTRRMLDDAVKKAEEMRSEIEVPEIKNEKGAQSAEKINQYINTSDFRKKIKSEEKRINETFFSAFTNDILEHNNVSEDDDLSRAGTLSSQERVYVLASSSMPFETLRNYVRSLDKLGDTNVVMVYRGFIGSIRNYEPTVAHIDKLLKKDANCRNMVNQRCEYYEAEFNIDPLIFRKFGVTKVPAVVYVNNVVLDDPGKSIGIEGNLKAPIQNHVIYGDASLEYSLERLAKITGNSTLGQMSKRLNGGYYEEK